MTLKVVGAGFGRTGTNSLKLALEQLGFGPCHHMFEVGSNPEQLPYWQAAARGDMPDWDEVFEGYNASVDWPSSRFWRETTTHFPNAKVLLSIRPFEGWFKSIHATIYPNLKNRAELEPGIVRDRRDMAYEIVVEQTFGGDLENFDHAKTVFENHIAEVQRTIAADRLLTYDVAEGWAPLCVFLGVPVPETPFPRTNSTGEFQARGAARSRAAS